MTDAQDMVRTLLFELKDEKYRDFHSSLMPTISKYRIIGVRVPRLRKLSRLLYKNGVGEEFINKYHTGRAGGFITALKGQNTGLPLKGCAKS